MPAFSAALFLGGKSERMGRDKALLPHSDGGVFWERQLAVLAGLKPAEILWSGPPREGMPEDVRVVVDAELHAGPLGGLVTCLEAMRTELLLVLAIDLAQITGELLQKLLDLSTPSCGAVVRIGSHYEPLAAVYPRAMQPLAAEHLTAGRLVLQDLVRAAVEHRLIQPVRLSAAEEKQFRNFNTPGDVAASTGRK